MKCDGSPDPTILPNINMYMSLWHEDKQNMEFRTVLTESELVLKVVIEVVRCHLVDVVVICSSSAVTVAASSFCLSISCVILGMPL